MLDLYRTTYSHLGALAMLGLLALAACGDEEPAPADSTLDDGDGCGCPNNACVEGECILIVRIEETCADAWGQARVFVGDLNATEPVGYATPTMPFRTCEPFRAPTNTQDAETFQFIVESEDTRLLLGSTDGSITFECAGSRPFEFTATCP